MCNDYSCYAMFMDFFPFILQIPLVQKNWLIHRHNLNWIMRETGTEIFLKPKDALACLPAKATYRMHQNSKFLIFEDDVNCFFFTDQKRGHFTAIVVYFCNHI